MNEPDVLGRTDREIARHRDAEDRSRVALAHAWRLLLAFEGDASAGCRLYDAIERSLAANARQVVLDWVEGGHLIALTDCPLAYLRLEASRLGIRNLADLLGEDDCLDNYRADIEALERGEQAPSSIPAGWR